jgi:putative tryptophan/tyrosine transport system substrate-binding protein
MRRRDFIAGLMFAAVTGRAQAQQTAKVYRIAIAHPAAPVADINQASKGSVVIPAVFEELTRLGYVEGRNLLIERYSGEGRAAHYPDLARQIVSRYPDLIIAIDSYFVLNVRRPPARFRLLGPSLCQSSWALSPAWHGQAATSPGLASMLERTSGQSASSCWGRRCRT